MSKKKASLLLVIYTILSLTAYAQKPDTISNDKNAIRKEAIEMRNKIDKYIAEKVQAEKDKEKMQELLTSGNILEKFNQMQRSIDSLVSVTNKHSLQIDSLQKQLVSTEFKRFDKSKRALSKKRKENNTNKEIAAKDTAVKTIQTEGWEEPKSLPQLICSVRFDEKIAKLNFMGVLTVDSALNQLYGKNIMLIAYYDANGLTTKSIAKKRAKDIKTYLASKDINVKGLTIELKENAVTETNKPFHNYVTILIQRAID